MATTIKKEVLLRSKSKHAVAYILAWNDLGQHLRKFGNRLPSLTSLGSPEVQVLLLSTTWARAATHALLIEAVEDGDPEVFFTDFNGVDQDYHQFLVEHNLVEEAHRSLIGLQTRLPTPPDESTSGIHPAIGILVLEEKEKEKKK